MIWVKIKIKTKTKIKTKINLTCSLETICRAMNQDIHKTNNNKNNTFSNSK